MADLPSMITGMELAMDRIEYDMKRQFPKVRVRCLECNRTQLGSWSYIKTGWPKCHGQTMRLETS